MGIIEGGRRPRARSLDRFNRRLETMAAKEVRFGTDARERMLRASTFSPMR